MEEWETGIKKNMEFARLVDHFETGLCIKTRSLRESRTEKEWALV